MLMCRYLIRKMNNYIHRHVRGSLAKHVVTDLQEYTYLRNDVFSVDGTVLLSESEVSREDTILDEQKRVYDV